MIESDAHIISQYLANHDERLLEVLVRRNLPLVLRYIRNFTGNADAAADIAQETFVKVWKNLRHYDPSRPFQSWLFTIAQRTAIDELRKRQAIPFSAIVGADGVDLADMLATDLPSPLQSAQTAHMHASLATALHSMPSSHARIVQMHLTDDLTFAQIARRVGAPLNTVKSTYRRALGTLRRLLSDR